MAESWLIRDGMDRERMLDMDRRIHPLRVRSLAVLAVCLLVSGPWLGWWTLVPLTIAGIFFRVAEGRTKGAARPEYTLFAAWVASEVMIAASVALTGGPESPALPWFAIPIVTLSARFSTRGVVSGVVMALAMMIAVTFGVDAGAVIDKPPLLLTSIALVISTAILSTAVMQSDLEHRSEAVIDALTGLLNRNALRGRTQELTERSAITGEPVAVIVGDLDNFKDVNDEHGHAAGDAVLKDVAYIFRKELRAFDLAYRIGGEEFVVLVAGANLDEGVELARRLRAAIAADRLGGFAVTMSFGVSASERGEPFEYEKTFARADAALYDAKHAGRNCVRSSAGEADHGARRVRGARR